MHRWGGCSDATCIDLSTIGGMPPAALLPVLASNKRHTLPLQKVRGRTEKDSIATRCDTMEAALYCTMSESAERSQSASQTTVTGL